MMKKGFLPIALLCSALLVGGLAGCVNNGDKKQDDTTDKSVYTVAISNKTDLQAEWHVNDQDRKVEVALTKDGATVNVPAALADGSLLVSSSNTAAVSVIGQKIKAVAPGEATITVSYKGLTDSVTITAQAQKTNKEKYSIAHEGTEADPLDNTDAVKVAMYQHENASDGNTPEKFYIKGIVDSFYHAPGSRTDGKVSWYMKKADTDEKRFEIYLCEKEGGVSLTDDDIWKGAEILVQAQICYYANGNQPETPAATFIRNTGNGAAKPQPKQTISDKTIAQILEIGKALDDGDSTWDLYVVEGFIIKKTGTNYFLADAENASDADEKALFELYNFSDETYNDRMTIGAKIKFKCSVKNYHGQIENAAAVEDFEFLADGQEPEIKVSGPDSVATPVAGTAYKLGVLQTTLNKNLFFAGAESGNYLATSENWGDAADIVLEEVTGGYNIKVGTKYLNAVVSGKYVNGKLQDAASTVYEWNEQAKSLVTKQTTSEVTDEYFYLGCYGSNSTFGFSNISYLIKDGKLVAGQFAVQLYAQAGLVDTATELQINQKAETVVGGKVTLAARANPYNLNRTLIQWESSDDTKATVADGVVTALAAGKVTITAKVGEVQDTCEFTIKAVNSAEVENPTTGVEYLAGILKENVAGTALFIDGKVSSNALTTTLDPTGAAKVELVEAAGGVKVKVKVGSTVKYLAASVRASGTKDYNDLALKDNEADGSIFRIDENIGSLVINLTGHQKAADDVDYYIGTYNKSGVLNSTSLSLSKYSYIWDSANNAVKDGQYAIKMMTGSIAD